MISLETLDKIHVDLSSKLGYKMEYNDLIKAKPLVFYIMGKAAGAFSLEKLDEEMLLKKLRESCGSNDLSQLP